MRLRLLVAVPIVAAAIVACGAKSPVGDISEALDPSTEPIRVTAVPDAGRVVSARFGPEGGTLSATGADGSRFTLEIPAGALVQEVEVSMTPLTSVEGLPWESSQTVAVQLEPSGLAFYDYVTLVVEPAAPIPVDQQIPIGVGQEGDLYLSFLDVRSESIRLMLDHFSSAGASKGLLASTDEARQRLGGDVERRLQSILAAELARARQAALTGGEEPDLTELFEWARRTFEEHVLKPRLAAAGESCAAGRLAIETVLSFQRQMQLLGFPDADLPNVTDLVPTVARTCVREEYELCRDEHIIHRLPEVILSIERQRQLLGLGSEGGMDGVMAEAEDLARKCLRFELRFESSATVTMSAAAGTGTYTSEVETTVPIELQGSILGLQVALQGSSALDNTDFEIVFSTEGPCTSEDIPGGATFQVVSLSWDSMPPDASHPYGSVKDVRLTYAPGNTTESIIVHCPGFSQPLPSTPFWAPAHLLLHTDELAVGDPSQPAAVPDLGGIVGLLGGASAPALPGGGAAGGPLGATFRSTDWEVRGEELFAVKELDLSESLTLEGSSVTATEEGSFELYHRPQ